MKKIWRASIFKPELVKDRSGIVTLTLVLVVLIALILLGVMIVISSTTETKIIGNQRAYMTDLYQAESGINYLKYNFNDIVSNQAAYLNRSLTVAGTTAGILPATWKNLGLSPELKGIVKFRGTGAPSINEGNSVVHTKNNIYDFSIKTPNGAIIEIGTNRIFLKHDD